MKKSFYAILIVALSLIGAKSFAAFLDVNQISKVTFDSVDGTGPGGNGSQKNGVMKTK